MNDRTTGGIHWSFWAIGVVALLWNVGGVMNYFMQMSADSLAEYPELARAIVAGRPVWATAGFAVAVFGGAVGCLLLLMKRSLASYLFIASLVGAAVTMVHTLGVAGDRSDFGAFEILMYILMPLLVSAFLIWYSKYVQRRGWIG